MSLTCESTGSWWMMSKNARQAVDVVQLARQRAGEVEAEAVDVALDRPSSAASP